MNLFSLFFLIEIGLVIIVSIEIAKKYNAMLNEKFNYLKTKITNLETEMNEQKYIAKKKCKNKTPK